MKALLWRKLWLIGIDAVFLLGAFSIAYFLRLGTFYHGFFPFGPYISSAFLMIPLWIFFLAIAGRYSLLEKSFFSHLQSLFLASLAASLLFPLLFYFQNELFFSRGIVLLIFLVGTFFLSCGTFLERVLQKWEVSKNKNISRLLVIGANRSAEAIIGTLLQNFSRQKPVAILAPYGSKKKDLFGVPVLGKLDALERIVESQHISEIFLCEGSEHSMNILSFCEMKGLPFRTSAEALGIFQKDFDAQRVGDTLFLALQHSPLFGWGQFLKRGIDIVGALILLIFSLPLFFLQKFSALSQKLFLVLKGKMSLVGPIVLSDKETVQYFPERLKARVMRRFLLRPGLWGPSSKQDFQNDPERALEKEIHYIQEWSVWRDVMITIQLL